MSARHLWSLFAAALVFAGPVAAAPAWEAQVSTAGAMRLVHQGQEFGELAPGLFEMEWIGASLAPARLGAVMEPGVCRGQMRTKTGVVVESVVRYQAVPDGLRLSYELTPQKDARLNSLHVSLSLPARLMVGGAYVADGKTAAFPAGLEKVHLYSMPTRTLELQAANGERLNLQFENAVPVLVQDNRRWGDTFSIRVGPQDPNAAVWPAGKTLALAFTMTTPGGFTLDQDGPTSIQAGPQWLPLDLDLEIEAGSALDFSNLVPWHAPAGKYGRVIAAPGGKTAFADRPGETVRFYGFNTCGTAQYLTHEESDRLATRIQRLGYNAVRFHHHERPLVDRSQGTSTRIKPEELDQLDYLFAAYKKRGIYMTTDLFVSRPVFASEVWEGATGDVAMNDFKMAVLVNERAFANFKEFSKTLLGHKNPYTGLTWAEDPALGWLSLVNEGNPGNFIGRLEGPLKEDWVRAWNRWLAARYPSREALAKALGKMETGQNPAEGTVPLPTRIDDTPAGIQLSIFLAEVERDFVERTRKFLRDELGCQALLTNMNGWTNPVQGQVARTSYDYVDDHFYVDHPQFLEKPWSLPSRCPNTSPVAGGATGGRHCAFVRLMDRPYTLSEYNYSGPGRFRGVGGILTGVLGSVQDWSVIWRFAYSHGRGNLFKPSTAGYFDMASDPLSQAADRASICLFRREDMRPATRSVAIAMTPEEAMKNPRSARGIAPSWNGLAWVTRVGTVVTDNPAKATGADLLVPLGWSTPAKAWGRKALAVDPYSEGAGDKILAEMRKRGWVRRDNRTDFQAPRFQSETGELTVDGPADTLTLDTARTAGGYAPSGKRVETKAASIAIDETDATVWVSSLDGAPIAKSRRLLVTHLTDLQNTDVRYADKAKRILLSWGKLPHLVRAGRATVTLRLENPGKARVWGLATSGKRLAPISTRVENGALVIPLSVDADGKARMLYEVEVGS